MWLSVIIPCYNCESTIARTLDSIVLQNEDRDNYEIIICNDHSQDATLEICHTYDDILPLKYVDTKPHGRHCPNNTRYDGYNASSGEWVTFIDDDDTLTEGVFALIKQTINESKAQNPDAEFTLISGEAVLISEEQVRNTFEAQCNNLMHGKFYYRDFLQKADLEPQENIVIYEDILFNSRIVAYCAAFHKDCIFINQVIYNWYLNPDSFSHWLEPLGLDFDIFYFDYWVESITWPFFEAWEKYGNETNRDELLISVARALISFYFLYMVNLQLNIVSPRFLQIKVKEVLKRTMRIFGCEIVEIITYALSDPIIYNGLRESVMSGRGMALIESKTFYQFIMDTINDVFDSGFVVQTLNRDPQEQNNVLYS